MKIPINNLQSFLRLVAIENVSRAAQEDVMTQATPTKIIQCFEDNIGEQWLIRNNQQLELTQTRQ